MHPGQGSLNADNYVYFALEAFFVQRCPPVVGADGKQRARSFGAPLAADWPGLWYEIRGIQRSGNCEHDLDHCSKFAVIHLASASKLKVPDMRAPISCPTTSTFGLFQHS